MTDPITTDRLTDFVVNLECLDRAGRKLAIMAEILDMGGCWQEPQPADDRASHLYEISLHDIIGRGFSEDEAILSWTRAARAVSFDIEDDGFITLHRSPPFNHPRDHFEETVNARFHDDMRKMGMAQ